jgi:hypothetical protein
MKHWLSEKGRTKMFGRFPRSWMRLTTKEML